MPKKEQKKNDYQLRPSDVETASVEIYNRDVKVSYRKNKPSCKGNVKTGVRGEVKELSYKSRKRLAFYANNTDVQFYGFVTLTYPESFPRDGKAVKKQLNAWLNKLRAKYDGVSYLWYLEFQKRGAPHFHLLISQKLDIEWVSNSWYDSVGSGDDKHLKAGTNVQKFRSRDGGARYATKYAMKPYQKQVPEDYANVGRFWGCSRDVKPTAKETRDNVGLAELMELAQRNDSAYKAMVQWLSGEREFPLSTMFQCGLTDGL